MTPEQERLLRRLEQKVNTILDREKHWVKVSAVRFVTGWTAEELRRARETGLIECRHAGNGIEYNIKSLPECLLIRASEKKSA